MIEYALILSGVSGLKKLLNLLLFLIALMILVLAIVFNSLNQQVVEVNYLAGLISLSVSQLAGITLALGFITGFIFSSLLKLRKKEKSATKATSKESAPVVAEQRSEQTN